jgi:CrcB protein
MTQPSPTLATLYVALGGGVGAVLRYQTGRAMTHWLGAAAATAFPWATLTVNVVGSLAMGLLVGWLARHGDAGGQTLRLLLGVGVLGGFTTFSSFSMEAVLLIERGSIGLAALYAGISVAAGIAAMVLGLLTMRVAA